MIVVYEAVTILNACDKLKGETGEKRRRVGDRWAPMSTLLTLAQGRVGALNCLLKDILGNL